MNIVNVLFEGDYEKQKNYIFSIIIGLVIIGIIFIFPNTIVIMEGLLKAVNVF